MTRTRRNWFRLKFRSDIGQKLFPVRVGRPWHRVPREAVAAPGSLEVFKARLDGGWGQWKVSLPIAGMELDEL